MKKKLLLFAIAVIAIISVFAISASAAPAKPELDVAFGEVKSISNFEAPSQLYVNTTERVLLTDGNGNYVTYPTYYITKDSTTFDVDFTKLNNAQSVQYTKASIVMLEIPSGITTFSNSYFSGTNFASCQYVQFPGSATSYGNNLFQNNKAAKIVEFLDGTEPVTMGDGMFSGVWNGGPVVEYVKFPNNLVSIGNNTFGKAFKSKTIILGENLEKIGTGFFIESTPSNTDTFIYVSDKFFAAPTTLFSNLFGGYDGYHSNYMRLTIFYAGSQENAQKLVNACAELQTGYVFNNATLVSVDEYDYETHKPTSDKSATIVYGVNSCDAFYNGIHDGDDGNCTTTDTCSRCETTFEAKESHNITVNTLVYANGLGSTGVRNYICDNPGCYVLDEVNKEYEAIIGAKGYSFKENDKTGLDGGYSINTKLLALYEEVNGSVKIGIIIVNAEDAQKNGLVDESFELVSTKGMKVEMSSREYSYFDLKITGFNTEKLQKLGLIITSYVIDDFDGDGTEEIKYIQHKMSDANESPVTIGGVVYNTVTVERAYKERYPNVA